MTPPEQSDFAPVADLNNSFRFGSGERLKKQK